MERLLALTCLVCLACDEGRVLTVLVRGVEGVEIRSLKVQIAHRAAPHLEPSAWQGETLFKRLDRFSVKVGAQLGGELLLQVAGLAPDGCRVAKGQAALALGPLSLAETTVELEVLEEAGCLLRIENTGGGSGRVRIEPSGEVWDSRSPRPVRLRPAERVRLLAQPDDGSYFLGWSGPCRGASACELTLSDEALRVGVGLLRREVCSHGFCWENPLPHGNNLRALHVFSERDAWAAGTNTLLHWNGSFWAPVPSGLSDALLAFFTGVWGAHPDDVWVTGFTQETERAAPDGILLRWDGTRFAPWAGARREGALHAIWGTSTTNAWAVGAQGLILHFDGLTWTAVPGGTTEHLRAVWGSRTTGVWVAGDRGTLLHGDGSRFRRVESGTEADLYGLWGDGQTLFGVGDRGGRGIILRSDEAGLRLSQVERPLASVWGASPADVYAAGNRLILHWDGTRWSAIDSGRESITWLDVSGSGPDNVWFCGRTGALQRWNGSFLSRVDSGPRQPLHAVFARSERDIWAVGTQGQVLHSLGAGWLPVQGTAPVNLFGVWGGGPDEVFVVGEWGAFYRYEGDRMRLVEGQRPSNPLFAVWGFPGAEGGRPQVWAVGGERRDPALRRRLGDAIGERHGPRSLRALGREPQGPVGGGRAGDGPPLRGQHLETGGERHGPRSPRGVRLEGRRGVGGRRRGAAALPGWRAPRPLAGKAGSLLRLPLGAGPGRALAHRNE